MNDTDKTTQACIEVTYEPGTKGRQADQRTFHQATYVVCPTGLLRVVTENGPASFAPGYWCGVWPIACKCSKV